MSDRYLMALDAGGGSGRALLLDTETGSTRSSKLEWSHPTAPGTGGLGHDLDVDDIWRKLGEASRSTLEKSGAEPRSVIGIAVSSMRHTTLLLDAEDRVIFAAPNNDARSIAESFDLGSSDGHSIHMVTGHWPGPVFTGTRLMWMKSNEKRLLENARKVLTLSDWIAFRMGARIFAEKSQAGETMLFDLSESSWARGLLSSFGIDDRLFPDTVDAGTPIGGLSGEAASHLGLMAGTPIAAGGADTQCALLGSGAVEDGDIGVVAGTTMPVQLVSGGLILEPEGRLWSGLHALPGLFVLESNGLMAGSVLEWAAGVMFPDHRDPTSALFAVAAGAGPGSGGAHSTLGANIFDARRIEIPVGTLSISHMFSPGRAQTRANVSRALLEGIAFSATANIEQVLSAGCKAAERIKASGGICQSELWTQILSDASGRKVAVPSTHEVSALGTAICAGVGAGVFEDLASGAAFTARGARLHSPGEETEDYQRIYAGWTRINSLRKEADDLTRDLIGGSLVLETRVEMKGPSSGFRPRILVTAPMDRSSIEDLGELGHVRYASWRQTKKVHGGGKSLAETLGGFQVFVTEIDIVDFEAILALPELKAVVSCRGNPVNVDVESATAFGIPVLHTPGRNADAVAELTVAFMIMLARKLPEATRFLKGNSIQEGDLSGMGRAYIMFQGNELWRKTIGLIGMGNVGRNVARRVMSFGVEVLFFDPLVSADEGALLDAEKVGFEELLSRSDFVSLHAPATENTGNMINAEALSLMKENSFLINTARGSLVDEEALAEALESGRVAGAALDVFSVEPPGPDDRLASRADVITTPHIGGDTFEIGAHQGQVVTSQLRRLLSGEVPEHVLNPEVLEEFDWTGPRREPSKSELESLGKRERPTITS